MSEEERLAMDRDMRIEELTTLIQDTIGRQEDWAAYGGSVSSLRELNGNLIIKTTPENHRQIRRLLFELSPQGMSDSLRPRAEFPPDPTEGYRLIREFHAAGP